MISVNDIRNIDFTMNVGKYYQLILQESNSTMIVDNYFELMLQEAHIQQ